MDTGAFSGFEVSMRDPGIAWIQFNTPERLNGMTTAIKRDLIETVTQAQMDNRVRVVVFTGTGRAFCAGDDLKAYRDAELGGKPLVPGIPPGHDNALGTYNGLRTISQRLNAAVRGLDKLTIAAINGVAIQTGFSLALSCDFRHRRPHGAHGQRDAAIRSAARRRRPISARAVARRREDDGFPDAQTHRRCGRSAASGARQRSRRRGSARSAPRWRSRPNSRTGRRCRCGC